MPKITRKVPKSEKILGRLFKTRTASEKSLKQALGQERVLATDTITEREKQILREQMDPEILKRMGIT